MHFAIVGYDKPNSLAYRMQVRPDHLKYLDSLGETLVLASRFVDEKGDMVGTFMVIEAESLEAAKAAFGRDPFVARGVFDSITIKPWQMGINNTKK